MKKTKVILFILLFALVIGVSTQVKAELIEHGDGIHFEGTYKEFMQLSDKERDSIVGIILEEPLFEKCNHEKTIEISLKDMHLEDMKLLNSFAIGNSYCCSCGNLIYYSIKQNEEIKEIPNIKFFDTWYGCSESAFKIFLKYMKNIEEIDIGDCDGVKYDYSLLKELKELRVLTVSDKNITNLEQLPKLEKLEALRIFNNSYYGNKYDYSILKDFKGLKEVTIIDENMTDIKNLPKLENLETLVLEDMNKINNFREIGNKFKNIKIIRIYDRGDLEISYDDLIYVTDNCENVEIYMPYRNMIILKDCGTVIKDEVINLNIPQVFGKSIGGYPNVWGSQISIEENNCRYSVNEVYIDNSNFGTITLDTSGVGEQVAILNFNNDEFIVEFKIKYTVIDPAAVEPEPEQPTEPEPEQPVVEPEKPTEATGGFMSKILETIRNIIKTIIEKITNIFKVKY